MQKRPAADNRPMTYSTDVSVSRHSENRRKSSSDVSRRHGDKEKRDRKREDVKKKSNGERSSSSGRRREEDHKRKSESSRKEKKDEDVKEKVVDENKVEDEAVEMQGLVEVDCCEEEETIEQAKEHGSDEPERPESHQSAHSAAVSNASQ